MNRQKNMKTQFTSFVLTAACILGQATLALADNPAVPAGSAPAAGGAQQPSPMMSLVPFAAMFAVVYFLMIRPQQKRMKEQQALLAGLKDGDEVLTNSGIIGKVSGITDKVVTVEVDKNVRIKMLKSQVSQIIKGPISDNV